MSIHNHNIPVIPRYSQDVGKTTANLSLAPEYPSPTPATSSVLFPAASSAASDVAPAGRSVLNILSKFKYHIMITIVIILIIFLIYAWYKNRMTLVETSNKPKPGAQNMPPNSGRQQHPENVQKDPSAQNHTKTHVDQQNNQSSKDDATSEKERLLDLLNQGRKAKAMAVAESVSDDELKNLVEPPVSNDTPSKDNHLLLSETDEQSDGSEPHELMLNQQPPDGGEQPLPQKSEQAAETAWGTCGALTNSMKPCNVKTKNGNKCSRHS